MKKLLAKFANIFEINPFFLQLLIQLFIMKNNDKIYYIKKN